MLFRNLHLYRLTRPLRIAADELEGHLGEHPARPCGPLEPATLGWAPPLGGAATALTHGAGGRTLLCAERSERLLPATVVRQELDRKIEQLQADEARKVGRNERTRLREELVQTLMPQAFTRSSRTLAYLDGDQRWLVVDTASANRAEELITLLRDSVGGLSLQPPQVQQAPAAVLTRWLESGAPAGWRVLDECELQDTDDQAGRIRCKGQDLGSEEIRAHVASGMQVIRLALEWRERFSFVLHDDLSIRRLRFADVVAEELERLDADDQAAVFDAQFSLLTLELAGMLPELLDAFGGEAEEAYRSGEAA